MVDEGGMTVTQQIASLESDPKDDYKIKDTRLNKNG